MVIHPRLEPRSKKKAPYTVPLHEQLAALCTRKGKNGPEVLLVTSSRGRWILPKGWPMNGKTDAKAAAIEAWEEAGVKDATVKPEPMGSYITTKVSKSGDEEPCILNVYQMKVKKMEKHFPEANRRERRWVTPKKAAKMVAEDGLRAILKTL